MPLQTVENQYAGVNAHLHSKFQSPGDSPAMWPSFHNHYISHLVDALNTILPANYQAVGEQSLQVIIGEEEQGRIPDATIYQRQPSPEPLGGAATATLDYTLTLDETLAIPDRARAVVIYDRTTLPADTEYGQPVTRLELLSPTNKVGGSRLGAYQDKRREALLSGLPLVEVDLLHETGSPILGLKRYPDDEGSTPYTIVVSDPRIPAEAGPVRVYGFRVDEPLPSVIIPLAGPDVLAFDFNTPYQRAFSLGRRGYQVDYAEEPRNFATYAPADRERILARMAAVQELLGEGDNE